MTEQPNTTKDPRSSIFQPAMARALANTGPNPTRACLSRLVGLDVEKWPKSPHGISELTGLALTEAQVIVTATSQRDRLSTTLTFLSLLCEAAGIQHRDKERAQSILRNTMPDPNKRLEERNRLNDAIQKFFPDLYSEATPLRAAMRLKRNTAHPAAA